MSTKLKTRASTCVTLLTLLAAGLALAWSRYTHPDFRDRSTEDLSREAIALNNEHLDEPILVRLPSIARQQRIAAEVARRLEPLILAWQVDDERAALAATADAAPTDASPTGGPPAPSPTSPVAVR